MQISLYSLLISVGWGSLFILILFLLRKIKGDSKEGFLYYNLAPLSILLLGCIFRCVFPLDFPGFTKNISLTGAYVAVDTALHEPVIPDGYPGGGLTPLTILFILWMCGTAVLWIRFLRQCYKDVHYLGIYPEVESGPICEMAVKLAEKQGIWKVRVFQDPTIDRPMVCGILYPRILLPEKEYTEDELRYILSHELAHWKNGDMWVRFVTILICYLFWWNPVSYLLLYRLEETLEFRCDATVVASKCISDDERLLYLDAILRAIEHKKEYNSKKLLLSVRSEMAGRGMSKEDFQRRANIIGDYKPNPKKERRIAIFTAAIMIVALVFSYRFIIQPYYHVEKADFKAESGDIVVSPENAYLIQESDGTFSVYVCDAFYKNVSSEGAQIFIDEGFTIKNRNEIEE